MARIDDLRETLASPNVQQFLNTIALSEGTIGSANAPQGMNGYDVGFGNTRLDNLNAHPGRSKSQGFVTKQGKKSSSSTAGRYQFMPATWKSLSSKLGLTDFGPESQDLAALELIDEKGALNDVLSGDFRAAARKLGSTWTSLPSGGAGGTQNKHSWETFDRQVVAASDYSIGSDDMSATPHMERLVSDAVATAEAANNVITAPAEPIIAPALLGAESPESVTASISDPQIPEEPFTYDPVPEVAVMPQSGFEVSNASAYAGGIPIIKDGIPQLAIPETQEEASRLQTYTVYDEATRGRLVDIFDRLQDAKFRVADNKPMFSTHPTIFDEDLMNILEQV